MQRKRCSQCLTLWCETDDKCPRCNHPRAMNISTINAISLAHSNMMVRRVLVQARQEVEHVSG